MNVDDTLREAIAAFDAGNHAWGRFHLYTFRRYHDNPPAPGPAAVRAALQEAVLSVPHSGDEQEIREFRVAVSAALRELEAFIALLPDPLRTSDVLQAPEALAEALELLQPDA
jgi:hypothetical protein